MATPSYLLLYVDSPARSAAFYTSLLGPEPVESSPTFALFALEKGLKLGLWSRHTVEPGPAGGPGSVELAFVASDRTGVDRLCAEWRAKGLAILQEPVALDFGYTFVALDPDGHRLRVFTPEEQGRPA